MSEEAQIILLACGMLVLLAMNGVHTFLLFKLMGEVEKFGRLLLKLRRVVKSPKVP